MDGTRRRIAGRYELAGALGSGGHARVWRCVDVKLGVERAIKLIERADDNEEARRRLEREARTMARLKHPHVLHVDDVGTDRDVDFVVMDLAEGGSLADRLEQHGRLAPREAITWTIEVLGALEAAHALRIVHRDVKPQNVLLDHRGHALLADFGIALVDGTADRTTRTHTAMGSFAFMAPEQRVDARSVGPQADVYATGAMLYNLLTGSTPIDLFAAPPHSPRWSGIPIDLAVVLRRACAYEPEHRYPTAASMAADLDALLPTASGRAIALTHATVARAFGAGPVLEGGSPTPLAVPVGRAAPPFRPGPTRPDDFTLSHDTPLPAPVAPTRALSRPLVAVTLVVLVGIGIGVAQVARWSVAPEAPPPPQPAPTAPPPAAVVQAAAPVAPEAATLAAQAPAPVVAAVRAPPPPTRCGVIPDGSLPSRLAGRWQGSYNGATIELLLGGAPDNIDGTVCIGGDRGAPVPVGGSADGTRLTLEEPGGAPDAMTYALELRDDRLHGQASRRDGAARTLLVLHR